MSQEDDLHGTIDRATSVGQNGTDHAGGARDSTIGEDVAAASRASDGSVTSRVSSYS